MGKVILVSGPNGSGKSAFAESLVARTAGARYYIATMQRRGEENRERIEKHRRQRAGLGFTTLEEPFSVGGAEVSPESVVLLEDVSNLLANSMFEQGGSADSVYEDILRLSRRCGLLIAVTISGLSADGYDGETAAYIRALNELNRRLGEFANTAVDMRSGKPVYGKGGPHALA